MKITSANHVSAPFVDAVMKIIVQIVEGLSGLAVAFIQGSIHHIRSVQVVDHLCAILV